MLGSADKSHRFLRMPCAIGFYPGDRKTLLETINSCYLSKQGPGSIPKVNQTGSRKIVVGVSPHAGYIYSGPVAASLYHRIALDGIPQTFVMIGPIHGYGAGVGIMKKGAWRTPLGDTQIDEEFATALLSHAEIIADDPSVHEEEHSLEVQLPFLQSLYGDKLRIVPIATSLSDLETCTEIGNAIAETAKETEKDVVVIASTDMTHYGSTYGYAPVGMSPIEKVLTWVRNTDGEAIKSIQSLNERSFLGVVREKQMTMCGYAPVATAIVAAKAFGVSKAELVKYATSYDTQGSRDAIVGYCAMLMQK
ncbi:MAG: AmmeMemoRadiSam system protein B [Candidatus Atabeyarchaeum deiterrae]